MLVERADRDADDVAAAIPSSARTAARSSAPGSGSGATPLWITTALRAARGPTTCDDVGVLRLRDADRPRRRAHDQPQVRPRRRADATTTRRSRWRPWRVTTDGPTGRAAAGTRRSQSRRARGAGRTRARPTGRGSRSRPPRTARAPAVARRQVARVGRVPLDRRGSSTYARPPPPGCGRTCSTVRSRSRFPSCPVMACEPAYRRGPLLSPSTLRICIVYDCLYPYTIGGAERFYRSLAERLAAEGHEVTYLTLRQWERGDDRRRARASASSRPARGWRSTRDGRRRILPPLVFGLGVLRHLLRARPRLRRRPHGVVPVLLAARRGGRRAAGAASSSPSTGPRSGRATTGATYLGRLGGVGWRVQRRCIRVRQQALCSSELHARRLRAEGAARPGHRVLAGSTTAPTPARRPAARGAGRRVRGPPHPREAGDRARARRGARARVDPGAARARSSATAPSAPTVLRADRRRRARRRRRGAGLRRRQERVEQALAPGALPRPSVAPRGLRARRRRGGGARRAEHRRRRRRQRGHRADRGRRQRLRRAVRVAEDLAGAIVRVRDAGPALRESTARWFAEHAAELSLAGSVELVSGLCAETARR